MTTHDVTRRRFLQLSALSGASLLAACGSTPTAPAPGAPTAAAGSGPTTAPVASTEAVTVGLLNENWGEIYNGLMMAISDQFTTENPNIAIEWNFDQDNVTKLTTLLAANTPPDATIIRPGTLATLTRRGAIQEMDSLVQDAGLTRDAFVKPLYDGNLVDGKLYAIPGGADYICMIYSKDVFRAVGLDPEKPPTTIDELLGYSRQMLKKDAAGDIQQVGYIPIAGHLVNWSYIMGGKFYDEAGGKITANDPANIAALEMMANYVKELDVNKLAAFNARPGFYEAGNPFSTKQSAFSFDGFWVYEALDQHAPDIDYGVAYWPTMKGTEAERANYAISGWSYTIPTGSKYTEQAAKFIKYAFIDKCAEMGYKTLNGPCVISQLPAWEQGVKDKMGADNRMVNYLKVFTGTGAVATKYFPVLPVQSFYNDELGRVYDLVVRGEMNAQTALDEVTTNVQAELDKALSA